MNSKNENVVTGIFLFALIIGGILLLTRKPQASSSHATDLNRRVSGEVKYFPVIEDIPVATSSAKLYQNEEIWDIDWSEEGLPRRVTIHRKAIQS